MNGLKGTRRFVPALHKRPHPKGDHMDSRRIRNVHASALLAALLCMPATSSAAFDYDEAVDGDLSNDGLNPTVLPPTEGVNTLAASSVAGDLDYFTFGVLSGFKLDAIVLTSFDSTDDLAFAAVQSGTTFTEPPVGTDPANLLGWVHFGTALVGTDILDDMGLGDGAIGFTPPLPRGFYSFWIQQTGPEVVGYEMQFIFAATPVPPALYLLGSGLLALGSCTRGRLRNGKT